MQVIQVPHRQTKAKDTPRHTHIHTHPHTHTHTTSIASSAAHYWHEIEIKNPTTLTDILSHTHSHTFTYAVRKIWKSVALVSSLWWRPFAISVSVFVSVSCVCPHFLLPVYFIRFVGFAFNRSPTLPLHLALPFFRSLSPSTSFP